MTYLICHKYNKSIHSSFLKKPQFFAYKIFVLFTVVDAVSMGIPIVIYIKKILCNTICIIKCLFNSQTIKLHIYVFFYTANSFIFLKHLKTFTRRGPSRILIKRS